MLTKDDLIKVHDWLWEIPTSYRADMRVPARVYASEKMLEEIFRDRSLEQLVNVTTLPGIEKYALAMPDAHEGYGFPVGGVAAFDPEDGGIISPGGIGYDINCGVRLLRSERTLKDITPELEDLAHALYREIPSGVGKGGRLNLKGSDLDRVLEGGAARMVEMGYGESADLLQSESEGRLPDADASLVSEAAKARGKDQLGTMGAGNHFVEVGVVDEIFDAAEAARLGLKEGQITVLIHTGSRGLGHQIATDYIRLMMQAMPKYGITLPDRELACAPFSSPEGQDYWRAMSAGANFAWANRQLITWEVRKAWNDVLGREPGELAMVYDVAHNIAKIEEYSVNGGKQKLVVHRKGATRSFPGQPVLIPGSMGTASYLLVGQEGAMRESFGSSCHGAGRRMSRTEAKRKVRGDALKEELKARGIAIAAGSLSGLAEEAPQAYKDVEEVVSVVHGAGIAKKVARLRPVAVVKG
ncbi:MAG: RNA-splicing ligase RtcB [Candidatus Liptonbacteria bacterium RIFCSPHIGHO2_12_FULL_60_13]|uniref:tRNA-splicing ligase RtcB n=1 Tax=Candidatus Liptonbacteria bacterium RIFCSPHIGHO2_12_FULL_60_13 TaxID=1798648 RepID=A0A1G2CEQ3_9BACT|nr:MAG: RNA-splicing ligase RtcB [Candidatus Liptonbacteria bacterium RIFCSPHIGHO2_12_FULL_60_13]